MPLRREFDVCAEHFGGVLQDVSGVLTEVNQLFQVGHVEQTSLIGVATVTGC